MPGAQPMQTLVIVSAMGLPDPLAATRAAFYRGARLRREPLSLEALGPMLAVAVCGITLPSGLRESDRLPEPIFTPATKAASGHDINISEAEAGRLVGETLIGKLRARTLELFVDTLLTIAHTPAEIAIIVAAAVLRREPCLKERRELAVEWLV